MKKYIYQLCAALFLLTGCGAEVLPETEAVENTAVSGIPARLTVSDTVTIPLDPQTYGTFNRIVFEYTSDGPLQCRFRYLCDGTPVDDLFYLEEGTHTFAGLTVSWLDGESAESLSEITLQPLDGPVTLESAELSTETVPLLTQERSVYYLENDRYRLGIHLRWGGAISCIEDKACPLQGVRNLINEADTGRLVQQSWYGTGDPAIYDDAEFNNSGWVYNPVQGGDKYMNHSRLIDYAVTEDSLYIKTQPQDWARDGHLTPSYMENTYTLQEDVIRVDNRFVDFSGWEHPAAGQELPAFYAISYLNRFVWYDGASPWTGDTLSVRDDLRFWGDPDFRNDSDFPVKHSNTETWCAWVKTPED
ncbi:MAG: hypothetical protein IJX14_06040, partial [Clostridia bacterium]|nr:hypothetical protein [Clostridia bacterium]